MNMWKNFSRLAHIEKYNKMVQNSSPLQKFRGKLIQNDLIRSLWSTELVGWFPLAKSVKSVEGLLLITSTKHVKCTIHTIQKWKNRTRAKIGQQVHKVGVGRRWFPWAHTHLSTLHHAVVENMGNGPMHTRAKLTPSSKCHLCNHICFHWFSLATPQNRAWSNLKFAISRSKGWMVMNIGSSFQTYLQTYSCMCQQKYWPVQRCLPVLHSHQSQ